MKARVPAFDALDPGDLAIVPASALAVVAPGRDELRAFVDACVAARLSGLLLVEGDEAGEATRRRGRPAASTRWPPPSPGHRSPPSGSRAPTSRRWSGASSGSS